MHGNRHSDTTMRNCPRRARQMSSPEPKVAFSTHQQVDFVIVGSGAAGGVLARELSVAGFDVIVLEQGPYRTTADF
ncbi:MAG TPA: NAD(P)-binding protein, partial [Xanthomonadales bacterium]|nr:NAD(P)-binding protein [Xanthomonadales bacterium]